MQTPGTERSIYLDRALLFYDFLRIDGWLFPSPEALEAITVNLGGQPVHRETERLGLPSPDIALHPNCRFSISLLVDPADDPRASLTFEFGGEAPLTLDLADYTFDQHRTAGDSFHRFVELVNQHPGAAVLEIGSRARSGNVFRHLFHGVDYLGVDIASGENVDVVADAHELSKSIGARQFDFAFSLSVFEHLAMPWKAVVELNRVMNMGGVVYVSSHQTCGMHDLPYDFWRFSDRAFGALFNAYTGFEVVEKELQHPVHVLPFLSFHPHWKDFEKAAGYYRASVLAKKTGETDLDWNVPLETIVEAQYPA
jgi:methyltransferase family protein